MENELQLNEFWETTSRFLFKLISIIEVLQIIKRNRDMKML